MSLKSNKFWNDVFATILKEHDVIVEVTKDSWSDLTLYYKKSQHFAVADEIDERIEKDMYTPPEGTAPHLKAPDQMYGKIKNRNSGLRIVYYPYYAEGAHRFKILIVGPRSNDEVYKELKKRLKDDGRPEKE